MVGTVDETIAAIASASGGAARGIIRISGPDTVSCLQDCFRAESSESIDAVAASRVIPGVLVVRLAETDPARLPCDLLLWPTAKSYTRQPAAELHTFGSAPILSAALNSVCRAGARLAEPGEFTLRAFLAGRLDLVQAEAVLGLIDARDTSQRQTALRQLAGGLSQPLAALRDDLVSLLAELEAGLDFSEEDIEFLPAEELSKRLAAASQTIADVIDQLQSRGEVGAAYRAVLAGPPNAGKSSLFNTLITRFADSAKRRHPAIVSSSPGTTRDYLISELDLDGILCELVDTAGAGMVRHQGTVDQAACDQSAEQRLEADLLLDCVPADQMKAHDNAAHQWASDSADGQPATVDRLCIVTKVDTGSEVAPTPILPAEDGGGVGALGAKPGESIRTSAVSGEGISQLAKAIRSQAVAAIHSHGDAVTLTAIRCRESLRQAADSLDRAHQLAEERLGDELVASEVHATLHNLGIVVGTVYTDDILDRIFSSFCIGK